MGREMVDVLVARASEDPGLTDALVSARSPEEIVALATSVGVSLSVTDLVEDDIGSRELSDAELDAISGGAMAVCFNQSMSWIPQ